MNSNENPNSEQSVQQPLSRRQFLRRSGAAGIVAASSSFGVPYLALGQQGNDKLRIAFIGVGGIGGSHTGMAHEHGDVCTCYCDVDKNNIKNAAERWPDAKYYQDYREMIENEADNFDAVMIGTPDHHHYPATALAMKAGKHVYTQKPLTHTIWEARQLTKAAADSDIVTQMGNQGHANEGNRLMYDWINGGHIGKVSQVHLFTNRPIWPQGGERPEGEDEVPDNLDWDIWIGPAPMRPFKEEVYHPFAWRGWWDFGTGALGDMACHTMDCVFMALGLGAPAFVEPITAMPMPDEGFPEASMIRWHYPNVEGHGAVDVYWHDGGLHPALPDLLGPGRRLPTTGALFIGDKGGILSSGDYGDSPRIIPESYRQEVGRTEEIIERSPGHYTEWRMACLGQKPKDFAKSNFAYAGNMTENILLGNLALKMGRRIDWDSENLKATNLEDADQYINKEYRDGWKVSI